MEIYIWFSVYLVLLIFLGAGVFTLLSRLSSAAIIHWLLLPGTIVSEMAYILGCLITGGEVKRAKIMPEKGAKGGSGQPATEATPKLKFFGPVVAAMLSIVVCSAGIVAAHHLLDPKDTLTQSFDSGRMRLPAGVETGDGPLDTLWRQLHAQVDMLKQITQTLRDAKWLNWRVPLLVYLTICLGVTLCPARRPLRASLVAIVFIAAGIAVAGAIWKQLRGSIQTDIWPLLSFVWALLLLVLVLCLLISGVVGLMQALGGKSAKGAKAPKPAKAE